MKNARTLTILLSTLSSLVFHDACVAALPLCAAEGGYVSLKARIICLRITNISV